MSSIENLAKVKPSENAGSRSSNRFKYQLNWGFKKLLELEYNDEDYIIILDYHDDIVICNSEKQEDYIDFYQIKTKTTADNWSYALLNNPADTSFDDEDESHAEVNERKVERTKLSILAKLLKHTQDFPESRKLYFVTNSRLAKSLYLKGGDFVEFSMPWVMSMTWIQEKSLRAYMTGRVISWNLSMPYGACWPLREISLRVIQP